MKVGVVARCPRCDTSVVYYVQVPYDYITKGIYVLVFFTICVYIKSNTYTCTLTKLLWLILCVAEKCVSGILLPGTHIETGEVYRLSHKSRSIVVSTQRRSIIIVTIE